MYGDGNGEFYWHPEKYGLKILGELAEDGLEYEFNMFVVWQRESDGALFYASDSGCSCPSPFEDYEKLEDLAPLTADTWRDFSDDLTDWSRGYGNKSRVDPTKLVGLLRLVEQAL